MTGAGDFLTRTRGRGRLDWSDLLTYLYLLLGTIIMFLPVLWLVLSSFKTQAGLLRFPPDLLPYAQKTVVVEGYDDPLPIFDVTLPDGATRQLAQVRRFRFEFAGKHRAKALMQLLRQRHVAPMHGLGHHRRRGDADGTALAADADVLDPVLRHVQRHLQVVATDRVLAARLVRGRRQRAEVARRALVVHHHVLVEVEFGSGGLIHCSTFSARATPDSKRSTSACVL